MYKITLTVCCVFILTNVQAQQYKNYKFFIKNADSIIFNEVKYHDKTTNLPLNNNTHYYIENKNEVLESVTIIEKWKLTRIEMKKIINKLKYPIIGHSLPMEYNILLEFFNKGKIIQTVSISTYTNNLIVKKIGCKFKSNEIDNCFFLGMISKELNEYLSILLFKKKTTKKS